MNLLKPQTAGAKKRLLLVESYCLISEGLKTLIETDNGLSVIENTADLEKAVQLAERLKPDAVLLSISSECPEYLEIIPKLLEAAPETAITLLVNENDFISQQKAVRYGIAGVVYKEQNRETLVRAVKHVCDGGTWLNQKLITQVINGVQKGNGAVKNEAQKKIEMLTKREQDVIKMVAKGLKNKTIARQLYISEATVRHHLTSIFTKLEVDDRINLLIFGYRNGLVRGDDLQA